ncbi:apolipoprotein N-acyltransferase [Phenylobacterium terrae]|uniref:Apolipoprotein N-acyltransferase n=1 Tax=Phenylobacterium terrae TaxID=2665495 RepID=A0ABW4N0V2_9CAUL
MIRTSQLLSTRWGVLALGVAAGLAAGLAHPPFGLLPGLLGFAALLMLVDRADSARPLRSAFFRGWAGGLGYFAISVWWIAEAFLVEIELHGWMAPFALVFLSGGLALFFGLAALAYRASGARGPWRVLVFAGTFAALEWVRGHIFTGFPWNLPGEAWRAGGPPSQAAALVGAYGLTWITVALAAAPATLFDRGGRIGRLLPPALALAALAGLYGYGAARLAGAAQTAPGAPLIRIVQANVDQKEKWRPENLPTIFSDYIRLTTQPGQERPQVIVWPEGALPAVINDLVAPGSPYGPALAEALAPGQVLLMGANAAELQPSGDYDYFNSLVGFRREPDALVFAGRYDKHTLVPFGEYLPLGDLATRLGIRSLVHMPEDFTAGPPPAPLSLPGLPTVQPLVCYEALFPRTTSRAAARSGVRPSWMLNISNDAWFGATSGPLQHLNLASYRAIEEGLPMLRSTPTGVSAAIDAYGRILPGERLGLRRAGVIDVRLPPALKPTLYSRFGEATLLVMLAISAFAAGLARYRRTC